MAVNASQPVYPPTTLTPITSLWGRGVSEGVIQRFTSTSDRNAKWTSPPSGAMCVTTDMLNLWMWNGSSWQLIKQPEIHPFTVVGGSLTPSVGSVNLAYFTLQSRQAASTALISYQVALGSTSVQAVTLKMFRNYVDVERVQRYTTVNGFAALTFVTQVAMPANTIATFSINMESSTVAGSLDAYADPGNHYGYCQRVY